MKFLSTALVVFCAQAVFGDVYMHNMRGSNNRLNEANVNRNNANRLFDSQNNGKGGYCVGPQMNFYENSLLQVEWTAQHACGLETNNNCNIVVQTLCGQKSADGLDNTQTVRDGANTNRIQNNANDAADQDRGMHESYANYQACENTQRNQGLYIADRQLNGDTAQYTRQNNGGTRSGLECPEERDYYPYWRPSEWVDVAVLTSDTTMCPYYQAESQNVKARYVCTGGNTQNEIPITEQACQNDGGQWTKVPAHFEGVPEETLPAADRAPTCLQAPYSRDNHLGNGDNGEANALQFAIPNMAKAKGCGGTNQLSECACVLRVRYNITTGDYNAWGTYNAASGQLEDFIDYRYDGDNTIVQQDPDVSASNRTLPGAAGTGDVLSMALNTNQYGRTFQDRSYVFGLQAPPADQEGPIVNVNVRGKRGNIVQTYPATEYDFVPTNAVLEAGDTAHFQWTGCDTNPAGNAGEGTAQTDRSNIVQINSGMDNYPNGQIEGAITKFGVAQEYLFEDIAQENTAAYAGLANENSCKTAQQLANDNNNNQNNIDADEGNCMKLNPASAAYVDAGLRKFESASEFHYMSTRNNNFTNRSQKASITVTQGALPTWGVALAAVGAVAVFVLVSVAGLFAFAKTHPHSAVGNMFSRS